MEKVLVPLADGFEEIEAVTVIDVLRRAGAEVTVAGITQGVLTGSRKIKLLPDTQIDQIRDEEFDMVILPGGQPGVDHLRKNPVVLEILQKMHSQKKWIGAICAGPLILRDAGLIADLKLTSHPSVENDLPGAHYEIHRVVTDGHIITSRGPGTAMEFALKIVEHLCSAAKAEELSGAMLARI